MARISLVVLLVLFPLALRSAAAQGLEEVEIRTTHVSGNVYMLEGGGGNIGVSVGEDGILLVDDQFAPLAGKIRAALGALGEGKVVFVLNTHWHGDHTGGNPEFGREATIIAHRNVRERLSRRQELTRRTYEPLAKEGLPVITFTESLSVHFNGEEIRAVHLPRGHTDGDVVVFFPGSNVLHMGDQLFNGLFPFVDLETGGDLEGYTTNVGRVLAWLPPDAKVIAGHGPLATPEDVRRSHAMLLETTDLVRKRMRAGRTLEQIQAEGLGEKWKSWSWSFIDEKRWIETVHRSLSGRRR